MSEQITSRACKSIAGKIRDNTENLINTHQTGVIERVGFLYANKHHVTVMIISHGDVRPSAKENNFF